MLAEPLIFWSALGQPAGTVTSIAGSLSSGYADGQGTVTALFDSPRDVAIDATGTFAIIVR